MNQNLCTFYENVLCGQFCIVKYYILTCQIFPFFQSLLKNSPINYYYSFIIVVLSKIIWHKKRCLAIVRC